MKTHSFMGVKGKLLCVIAILSLVLQICIGMFAAPLAVKASGPNLITNGSSQDTWTPINGSFSPSTVTGPDGVTSNVKGFIANTSNTNHYILVANPVPVTGSTLYTVSFYAKAGASRHLDLNLGWWANSDGSSFIGGTDVITNLASSSIYSALSAGPVVTSVATTTLHGYNLVQATLAAPTNASAMYLQFFVMNSTTPDSTVFAGNGSVPDVYITGVQMQVADTSNYISISSNLSPSSYKAGNNVQLTANVAVATSTVQTVSFYDGDTLIGVDRSSPYGTTAYNVQPGKHTFFATFTNTNGTTTDISQPPVSLNIPAGLEQAKQSDSFVDSIGVNTHLFTQDPTIIYNNFDSIIKPELLKLGIRHIRNDGHQDGSSTINDFYSQRLRALTSAGIKLDLLTFVGQDPSHWGDWISWAGGASKIDALEGQNECDLFVSGDYNAQCTAAQHALWAEVKSDPTISSVPVISPTVAFAQGAIPDLSAYADYGASHPYPGQQNPEGITQAGIVNATYFGGQEPVMFTETGYTNDTNVPNGISEAMSASYVPRLFLDDFNKGVVRSYFYEFADQQSDPGLTDQELHDGLIRFDGSEKPAYTAMKNLIDITADAGPTFTPGTLSFSLSGDTTNVEHTLLQKRDGTFELILWQAVQSYDFTGKSVIPVTPKNLSLNISSLYNSVRKFTPSTSAVATPAAVTNGVVAVSVTDSPLVVEIPPAIIAGGGGTIWAALSNIQTSGITATSTVVSWKSDYAVGSEVDYGLSSSYGSVVASSTATTTHQLTLNNLLPATTYHFKVKDPALANYSADYSFTTQSVDSSNTSTTTPVSPAVPIQPTGSTTPTTSTSVQLINDNGTYYLLDNNQLHGVTSPGILNSYGFEFKDATAATADELALPRGSLLLPGNGALVKSKEDQTVYLISQGQRHGFVSAKVFTDLGFKFSSVLLVTNPELQALPLGNNLSNSTAAHMDGIDVSYQGTVYWINNGTRYPYPSLDVYNSWHMDGDFSRVVAANAADIALPVGEMQGLRIIQ